MAVIQSCHCTGPGQVQRGRVVRGVDNGVASLFVFTSPHKGQKLKSTLVSSLWVTREIQNVTNGNQYVRHDACRQRLLLILPRRVRRLPWRVLSMTSDLLKTREGTTTSNITASREFRCTSTRKTVPRNLDPIISRKFLESSMILRAGIPYGLEVSI